MKILTKLVTSIAMVTAFCVNATPTPYTIDVAFYVAPDAVATYGKEAVHTTIQHQLDMANTVYKSSGSDVTFVAKEIYTAADGSFDSYTTANGLSAVSTCIANLEKHAGLIKPGISGQHFYNDSLCDQIFPDESSGIGSEMGQLVQRTGADWVIVITSDYGSTNIAGSANGEPVGLALAMKAMSEKPNMPLMAHEMGHLFGLNDRYVQDSTYCTGNYANMLMCVAENVTVGGSLPLFQGSQTSIDSGNLDSTAYTGSTALSYPADFANEKMVIAKALAGMHVFYYTNNVDGATWYLQNPIASQATVKMTAEATSVIAANGESIDYTVSLVDGSDQSFTATSDVSVEVYTEGGSATDGVDYNADAFVQTLTFAAGESSKTISLPILKAGFNGSRTLTVGIRNANGLTVSSSNASYLLTITDTTTNGGSTDSSSDGSSSGGSSGGGSFDLLTLFGLLGLVFSRKFCQK